MEQTATDVSLLIDGKQAFPEILRCVKEARSSVEINMFIWRADEIGMRLAEAVLQAADRGVSVRISVDRYGMILEKSEESTYSFFHEKPSPAEWLKILALRASYPDHCKPRRPDGHVALLEKMVSHPNIRLERNICKADHSKYYIFDDRVLIFGGINVEDKENGADLQGRIYQDYMIKLSGESYVLSFRDKLNHNKDTGIGYRFSMNNKIILPHCFDMLSEYLQIIREAEHELVIVMAYFSYVPAIADALLEAWRRGVRITIVIPEHANFQDQSNRKAMARLMCLSNEEISVLLSPKMLHTKLIFSEKCISMGSCNLTPRSFRQLGELNFTIPNADTPFVSALKKSAAETMSHAKIVHSHKDISYNRLFAWIEERTV